jgi:hypothetical protein
MMLQHEGSRGLAGVMEDLGRGGASVDLCWNCRSLHLDSMTARSIGQSLEDRSFPAYDARSP